MSPGKQTIFAGELQKRFQQELQSYRQNHIVERLWKRDSSLWRRELLENNPVLSKLEWVSLPDGIGQFLQFIQRIFQEADADGLVDHALLTSESLNLSIRSFLAIPEARQTRKLIVFDSVAPEAIERNEEKLDLLRTLFVLSSKTRYGLRDHCLFLYFQERLRGVAGEKASSHFVSETEPSTYLASLSRGYTFREMLADSTIVPAEYCSMMNFAALLTAAGTAPAEQVLSEIEQIRAATSVTEPASANPALQLAALITAAVADGRSYLAFLASPALIAYSRKLGQLSGGSLARGERPLIPLVGAMPRVTRTLDKEGLQVVLSYTGDADEELRQTVDELRASKVPHVHIELRSRTDLLAETFKWEAATILACARLGLDPFALTGSNVPRAFARDMLEQIATGQNPFQRSPRIMDALLQLYADGATRREVSTLSMAEALRSFFRIATPGRHVSLLIEVTRTEETYGRFVALRSMISTALQKPVFMVFGPYAGEYFEYFFRESLPYGPCVLITTDSVEDKIIPGAGYTFGQLHQTMALSEYDALVHWNRPVIRLHLSQDLPGALDQLLDVFRKALHRFQP